MIRFFKPVLFVLIQFLFLQAIYSQKQVNIAEYLTQRFLQYCEAVPREEIFIHSDREDYISGEDLWFNLYLINRLTTTPSTSGKIAYFELLNQENRAIVHKNIYINKGYGSGHIVLPDTLSTGTYTVRAYTSWMKNFLPENCFMKEINVYNPFSKKAFKEKVYPNSTFNEYRTSGSVNSGLTLEVNNTDPDILEVFINTDNRYRSDNGNTFYLFIQTHGLINHVSTEKALTENTKVSIPKNELIPGINQISVFNAKGQPIGERYIYTPDSAGQPVKVSSSGIVKTRSKISLEIEVDGMSANQKNSGNLSISAVPESFIPEVSGIGDYMVFGSEFTIAPWITIRGRKISDLPQRVIDSLLLTLRSNWIRWENILSDNPPGFKFRPETQEHFLPGGLINRDPLTPNSGKYIFMSTPGKEAMFQYAITDSDGNFSFSVPIDGHYKDLIIQPGDAKSNYSVKVESPFSEKYFASEIFYYPDNMPVAPNVAKMIINYQISKIFETSYVRDSSDQVFPYLKEQRFYGKPDIELIMADYIKLPVMEEVFFELLPGVFLKNRKAGYEITIFDPVDNKVYNEKPGLMVDGVIINDASIIANLDPEVVEKIDVVKEKYFIGDYLFYGIVNVITKEGDFSYVNLPDYSTRLQYKVIDQFGSFFSPDYTYEEIRSNRIPDFRNTLYWNPSVKPDKNGKVRIEFWSSDLVSEYKINIQGITPEGKLVSYTKMIKVE